MLYCMLQYSDCSATGLLLFCDNWNGNIFVLHFTAEKLLQVRITFCICASTSTTCLFLHLSAFCFHLQNYLYCTGWALNWTHSLPLAFLSMADVVMHGGSENCNCNLFTTCMLLKSGWRMKIFVETFGRLQKNMFQVSCQLFFSVTQLCVYSLEAITQWFSTGVWRNIWVPWSPARGFASGQ